MTDARLVSFAERVRNLRAEFKADAKTLREQIAEADLDPAAVFRLAAWMDKDETERAEREAIDEQYRFLAGVLPEPAELPEESMVAKAAALYADGLTVRAVAEALKVSVGKAHKLKVLAAAFKDVHPRVNVNVNTPAHDPETGELPPEMTAEDLGDPLWVIDKPRAQFREKVRAIAASVKAPEVVAAPVTDLEMPVIPDFLRRTVAA